jgi:alpha-1,6-mannosyltransferase
MGVDVESFSPLKRSSEVRRRLLGRDGANGNTLLLLYVGRLAPEKNLGLLIAMLAELEKAGEPFRLIFAGDGIARESLRRDAQTRFAGKVVFLGHISDREELARLYASCDFFVHPNPAEPFGIAPLEAMASGLPVIAPNRGGITSYANESCAYLADPAPEAFARAVLAARRNDTERARRVKAARGVAETLAWSKVTEGYLDLYDALYHIGTGRQPMETASPAFASSVPAASRAARLHLASRFAQAIFSAYVRAHRVAGLLNLCSRSQHQTELKGAQSQ